MPSDDSKRKQKYERPAVKRVGLNGLPAGIQRELVTLFREQPAERLSEKDPRRSIAFSLPSKAGSSKFRSNSAACSPTGAKSL